MKIKRILNKFWSKLFNRVFIGYTFLMFLILISVYVSVSKSVTTILRQKDIEYNQFVLISVNNYIESKLNSVRQVTKLINMESFNESDTVFPFLNTKEYSDYNKYILDYYGFIRYFSSVFSLDRDISAINIYKKTDNKIYSIDKSSVNGYYYADESMFKEIIDYSNVLKQDILVKSAFKDEKTGNYCYRLWINLRTSDTFNNIALLDFTMDLKGIDDLINSYYNKPFGDISIITPKGDIIYDSSGLYYGKTYPFLKEVNGNAKAFKIEGKKYNLYKYSDNDAGLIIVETTPESKIEEVATNIKNQIIFAFIISLIISPLFMYFESKIFSKRIEAVTDSISRVKDGDLSKRIQVNKTNDEITSISKSFNKMCDDLQSYIDKVYVSEINQKNIELKLKNTELKTLQAQINPHFLYNTLEMIRMKAILNGAQDAGDMTLILSKLFRNSIKEAMIITVDDEIENAKLFIKLYEIKYDNLSVTFEVDESILGYAIVRSTIQPVLENSLLHGYINKKQFIIKIKGYIKDDYIYFDISDNGRGIAPKRLRFINHLLSNYLTDDNESKGLSNINERINLVFEGDSGLRAFSNTEEGTLIKVKMKAKKIEEIEQNVQSINS